MMQTNVHYRVRYKVSYRSRVGSRKKRVKIHEKLRVNMIANQADKPKIWEVRES